MDESVMKDLPYCFGKVHINHECGNCALKERCAKTFFANGGKMPKHPEIEYMTRTGTLVDEERLLKECGDEGWQLCSVTTVPVYGVNAMRYYFSRPKLVK